MRLHPGITATRLMGDLNDQELKQLSSHDIVIMQDRSSSMGEQQMPSIIANSRNGIFIGTKLAAPMHDQLSQYFQRRATGKARPLIIAVITDGKPQDDHDLRDVIIQATQMMKNPSEIKIRFLQIGNDEEGQKKLYKLDQKTSFTWRTL